MAYKSSFISNFPFRHLETHKTVLTFFTRIKVVQKCLKCKVEAIKVVMIRLIPSFIVPVVMNVRVPCGYIDINIMLDVMVKHLE